MCFGEQDGAHQQEERLASACDGSLELSAAMEGGTVSSGIVVPPSTPRSGVAVAANLVKEWSGEKCKAWYFKGEVDASRLPRRDWVDESFGVEELTESTSLLARAIVGCGVIVGSGAGAKQGRGRVK